MKHPRLNINHFVNRYHEHYRCIFIDDKIFHWVEDESEFHEVFGYSEEWRNQNFVFEEYFWTVFRSPMAIRHGECLPYLLMTYLNQASAQYRKLYGKDHDPIKGQCCFRKKAPESPCLTCLHF